MRWLLWLSWFWQSASGCVLSLFRMVVAKLRHREQAMLTDADSLNEELERAIEAGTASYIAVHLLGDVWRAKWYQDKSREDLEHSIRLLRAAVSLCPPSASERHDVLSSLADVLDERYRVLGCTDDLQERVDTLRESMQLHAEGHPDRSGCLNNLANALSDRYARFGDVADLKERIRLHQEALLLHPEGNPARSSFLNNLANALSDRYARFGDVADLEKSIDLHQKALKLRPDQSTSLNNLAGALSTRYARFGDVADLEKSIGLHQDALKLRPEGHSDQPTSLNNLAGAFSTRYARFGDVADLEKSIGLHQEALKLRPEGHPERSSSLNNLANALSDRFDRFGDVADLQEQILLHQEALECRPEGNPDRSTSLNNFANAFSTRYKRFRDVADLEKSIRLHQEALKLRSDEQPTRSISLNNLANALGDRYACFGDIADLKKSILLHNEALALRPNGHPDRSASLNNLAGALSNQFAHSGDVADLEESIRLYEEALSLHPEGHPNRAASLSNLAGALTIRYARFGNVEDVQVAISLLRSGLTDAYSSQAMALQCAFRWIGIAEEYHRESLGEAFIMAVASLRQYLSIGPTTQLQYKALLRETRVASLPIDAAAYFLGKGDMVQAIELLDEGRALLISEARRFREPITPIEREMIGEGLSSRYLDVCKDLRDLSNSEVKFEAFSSQSLAASKPDASSSCSQVAYSKIVTDKRLKLKEHADLLHQIRQLLGCEHFQMPPKFEKLMDAADEGPVVVINCSKRRSDVVIVFSDRFPLHIPLSDDFFEVMKDTSEWYLTSMSELGAAKDIASAISDILEPVVEQLWMNVVRRVVKELRNTGIAKGSRIWWCPTSFLTSLPIHAAGKGSEWLIDHYVSSYTPTMSALISARQATGQKRSSPRILVVAQTKSSGLKNAELEMKEMKRFAAFQKCLDGEDATPLLVREQLASYDWAHVICHGIVAKNPLESYLRLYDENKLSLNDIIKLHMTNAKFAFLAACHSAAQSRDEMVLRDEILHLAAAMQVSGFRSVVGTMWQMKDGDGPRMARKFYEEIFKGECAGKGRHTLAAHALWKAVRWLKDESMTEEKEASEGKPKDGDKDKEGMKRTGKKGKEVIPLARWANYIHIGS